MSNQKLEIMKIARTCKGHYQTEIDGHPFHFVNGSEGWYVMTPSRGLSDKMDEVLSSMKPSYSTKKELINSFESAIS